MGNILFGLSALSWILLMAAALAGGVANALAGGGTFIIFPSLVFAGIDPVVANATSAIATLPGGAVSAWVYRHSATIDRRLFWGLIGVSVVGGVLGSQLLLITPSARFARIVPYLMLAAALVFTFSRQIRGFAAAHMAGRTHAGVALIGNFLISVYGGYFNAGMGVLWIILFMMALHLEVQQSAGVRMWCGTGVNVLRVVIFAVRGIVDWTVAIPMVVFAVAGGYAGARTVKRLHPELVHRVVLVYAWITTIVLLIRSL
jgi:uncharacterized membrane protein YfcA